MKFYFFFLGASLGMIIQVLVIAVQNTVRYEDLGAATSGVTFFRTIGGSFGVSVFGAIFANELASKLAAALHGARGLPPGVSPGSVQSDSAVIRHLPAELQHAILHAYSQALHTVFLTAVPIAGIAFILAFFLREVPLRSTAGTTVKSSASVADLGEGFGGAPTQRSSEQEAERVAARLSATELRRFGYARIARSAGLDLPGGACWVLAKLARHGPTPGPELASMAGVTVAEGRPTGDLLVARGLVTRTDGVLALTTEGSQVAERLVAAQEKWVREELVGWSPDQYAELSGMLDRLAREVLGDDADRHLVDHHPERAERAAKR
jgi:DNA-binding MarR family transcriptional regulator